MRAGKLQRRIQIQRKGETVSPAGTVSEGWTPIANVRAEVIQQSAVEFLRGEGEAERVALVFRIRYVPSITTADRILFDGNAFDLVEVRELGRKRGLELRVELVK